VKFMIVQNQPKVVRGVVRVMVVDEDVKIHIVVKVHKEQLIFVNLMVEENVAIIVVALDQLVDEVLIVFIMDHQIKDNIKNKLINRFSFCIEKE